MTRTEARNLFGDPENMSVSGGLEHWEYGNGEITFDMYDHKDGSLFSEGGSLGSPRARNRRRRGLHPWASAA